MVYIKVLVATMVVVLLVAGISPAGASDAFPDVADGHPFHDEIAWLANANITTGYDDGTFRPTRAVTRQAIAAYLYRYADEPAFTPPATATFSDVPTGHPFYKEIEWLASTAITTGYTDGTFQPTRAVTRQAIAAYLYRYDQAFGLCTTQNQIPQTECDALVAIYDATGGPGWTNNTNWLTTNTPCDWYRVACASTTAATTYLTGLDLYGNSLTGTIPPEVGNLTNLTYLYFNANSLTGTIPTQIGNLTNLEYLSFNANGLTGTIPTQIGNLTNLVAFYLYANNLTGTIPTQMGNLTNLRYMSLIGNELSGPVPPGFLNMTNMSGLDLWSGSGNGCFTSSSVALTSFLNVHDSNWAGGCA